MTGKATISRIGGYITQAEAEAAYRDTHPSDTDSYGDVVSSIPRALATFGESIGNGFLTVSAFKCPKDITFTKHRLAVPAAGVGASGTFDIGIYTGASPAALVQQRTYSGNAIAVSTGVKEQTVSSLTVARGTYLGFAVLALAFTTSPKLASTVEGVGFQFLLNAGVVKSVYKAAQVLPLPTNIDMTTGFTNSNQDFWHAYL